MKVKYFDLINKKVFISGGADGIGSSIVEHFCEQGAEVIFIDINTKKAKELIKNIKKKKFKHKLIVATTKKKSDDKLVNVLRKNNINFFRGSSRNLIKRFFLCAEKYKKKKI